MVEEFRTDVTKTKKDGTRGALRIDYGDPRKPEQQVAWLWRYLDGARTPNELSWGSDGRTDRSGIGAWVVGGAGSV
ncbi:MAG: hypothetical protein ACLP01_20350, partial [Solirubrobacteraceae bacterium]